MSVELTGATGEQFETRRSRRGLAVEGEGRLRRLNVEFGEGWLWSDRGEEAGVHLEHGSGARATVQISSGPRVRIQVMLTSNAPRRSLCRAR